VGLVGERLSFLQSTLTHPRTTKKTHTQSTAASGEAADRLAAQAAADVQAVEAKAAARAGRVVEALLGHVTAVQAAGGR
jgi:hypothetical protein